MNFGVIEDCNFIMSYCELVNKIKAEPLKYIDEYNLLYLRNYLDGYYYFKKYNGFLTIYLYLEIIASIILYKIK